MKKESYRDCATNAFRLWAALGKPTYAEVIARVEQLGDENEIAVHMGGLYDILACERVWNRLMSEKPYICDCVEYVYMHEPNRGIRYREIGSLVLRFSVENHVSERQVWNWLAEAREEYAVARGMRIESNEDFLRAYGAKRLQ